MYQEGELVIERTGHETAWSDAQVRITSITPTQVTTETGLTYTPHGLSDTPGTYRSIRHLSYLKKGIHSNGAPPTSGD